jgi:hypothetical protein
MVCLWLALDLDWPSGAGDEAVESDKMVLSMSPSFGILSSSFSDMYVAAERPMISVFSEDGSISSSGSESTE